MKLIHLFDLILAAEIGCKHIDDQHQKSNTAVAIEAAYDEYRKRQSAKQIYRRTRPAQTVTRKLIRDALLEHYHKAKLNRLGQWLVQPAPGTSWQLLAMSDLDAQEHLLDYKEKSHACTEN